jgi:hypothetical protein
LIELIVFIVEELLELIIIFSELIAENCISPTLVVRAGIVMCVGRRR